MTQSSSPFWEGHLRASLEDFGRHHTPPRLLLVGPVLAGKRTLANALKSALESRSHGPAASSNNTTGEGGPGQRRTAPPSTEASLTTAVTSVAQQGVGLEQLCLVREGSNANNTAIGPSRVMEVLLCDKPELLRFCICDSTVESTVVLYVVDGADPTAMRHEARRWVAAVNAAVERAVDQGKAALMLAARLAFASSEYNNDSGKGGDEASSSLRRSVAQRLREHLTAAGSVTASLEGGHPAEDPSAVSLLPGILCVTKLDVLERASRAAAGEANQKLLLQGFPVLQFVLQTARKLALDAKAGMLAINAKAPTDANTTLLAGLLRYVISLQRCGSAVGEEDITTSSSSSSSAAPGTLASSPDRQRHHRSFTDSMVSLFGNHCFVPIGFDAYSSLHSIVFSPDVAAISDFFRGDEPGAAAGTLSKSSMHDEILRKMQEEAESSVKNVWEEEL
jgi:hypothetical protein